jgi:anti-sigma B factor antagonist
MLTIEQRTIPSGIQLLQLQGRVTLGRSAQELEWTVDRLMQEQAKRVVFDLAGVNFVDSTGVGIIVMCAGKLKKSGGSLRVAGATGVVKNTLELCRVTEIVPLFGSVDEAASSFDA